MILTIKGTANNELLENAVRHFLAFYPELEKANKITIRFFNSKKDLGFVAAKKHNKFVIFLSRRLNTWDMVQTLFHELTHVLQFLRGDLKHDKKGHLLWKGKCYKYKNCPSEKQARKFERKLLKSFRRSNANTVETRTDSIEYSSG